MLLNLTKNHQTIQLPQRNHDYAKDTVRATGLHTVWSPSTVSPSILLPYGEHRLDLIYEMP